VSAYRSHGLAEELKQSLRSAGYDAYLIQVGGEDGKSRFRVRVGSYPARVEAERVAERLKTERSLSPFVVPKN
jgi:cell division septation protein DedD